MSDTNQEDTMEFQYSDAHSADTAIRKSRLAEGRKGAFIVITRLGGRFSGPHFPSGGGSDEQRRRKIDFIEVCRGRGMATVKPCSTFPFYDVNGQTKVAFPAFYHAAMAIGEHKGRPAIVNQGLTAIGTWVYTNPVGGDMGGYMGDNNRFSGINIHSDKGCSEGCITLATQEDVQALIDDLTDAKGDAVHSDGRQLFDLYVVQVVSL